LQQGVQLTIIQGPFALHLGMNECRQQVRLGVAPALGNQAIGITAEGHFCACRLQLLFRAHTGNREQYVVVAPLLNEISISDW
jgi:hypothetical protein